LCLIVVMFVVVMFLQNNLHQMILMKTCESCFPNSVRKSMVGRRVGAVSFACHSLYTVGYIWSSMVVGVLMVLPSVSPQDWLGHAPKIG
jgi:hypothetical protein